MAGIQFAMLYTNIFGERRIRVFNLNIPVTKNLNAYYKAADCEAIVEYSTKK